MEIAEFGQAKADWLRRFLALPNGIPSHDALGRVFRRLDPEQFQAGFLDWVQSASQLPQGELLAIDGKTLRGSGDRGAGLRPLYLVSTWAATNRLTLGQVRTTAHSGELYANLKDAFQYTAGTGGAAECRTVNKGHGRREVRQCRGIPTGRSSLYRLPRGLATARSVAQVSYQRRAGDIAPEQQYYLCSCPLTAAAFLQNARAHWTIENRRHWFLDVAFDEDHNRARTGHAPGNLAVVRQLALNLLRQEQSLKADLQAKRKRAGWDYAYLQKVLSS